MNHGGCRGALLRLLALVPLGCALTDPLDDVKEQTASPGTGGADPGSTPAANACTEPVVPATENLSIDSFDDGDALLPQIAGRDGAWFAFPLGGAELRLVGDATLGYFAQVLGAGALGARAGAGVTLRARQQGGPGACAYDVSGYSAITFSIQSSSASSLTFSLVTLAGDALDVGHACGLQLDPDGTLSTCRFYEWSFSAGPESFAPAVEFQNLRDLEQASAPGVWELERVLALEWTAGPGTPFDFVLDDVAFLK